MMILLRTFTTLLVFGHTAVPSAGDRSHDVSCFRDVIEKYDHTAVPSAVDHVSSTVVLSTGMIVACPAQRQKNLHVSFCDDVTIIEISSVESATRNLILVITTHTVILTNADLWIQTMSLRLRTFELLLGVNRLKLIMV